MRWISGKLKRSPPVRVIASPSSNAGQALADISAARARTGEGGEEARQRKQGADRPQFGDALAHLPNAFGELAMLGQRVTAKDLADWHHRSQTLLAAIMYHSLTDLAGGIWFAPQLMQDACRPQRNSDGEGMRQQLRQR